MERQPRRSVFSRMMMVVAALAWASLLAGQVACRHSSFGGRAFGEVPLGSPVEKYLRTVWADFESLDEAEESGQLWIEVDPDGMRTVNIPAEAVGFGPEFGGVRPSKLSMNLYGERIMSAGFLYQAVDSAEGIAIATGIYDHLKKETGIEPRQIVPFHYVWEGRRRHNIVGIDTETNRIVWGITSREMMTEARTKEED